MPAGKERKGLSPGSLPDAGAAKLDHTFWAVEDKLLAQGVPPRQAAEQASRIAWTQIKKSYYKKGDRWLRRKTPSRNPDDKHLRQDASFARDLVAIDEALANGRSRPYRSDQTALKRRLMR